MKNKYNVLDLFCGCGGLSQGLLDAGLNVIAGIDIWDRAIESYQKNFNHLAVCSDLQKLPPELFEKNYYKDHKNKKDSEDDEDNKQINIIVGSPPCQGFSMVGKRDKNDPRNSLFIEFVKYINYFRPKLFLMENVMGILSMKNKNNEKMIDIIMSHLEINYNCIIQKLYASDFEVPQNRRRVIIIGVNKELKIEPYEIKPILSKDKRIPVSAVLLPREEIDKKYYLSKKALDGIKRRKNEQKERGCNFGAQFLDFDKPSYTISARYWKDGYDALVKYDDDNVRRLTITELKKIQSFPDDFQILGTKKDIITQIGNAVSCRFAYHLGKYIINILQQ